MSKIFASVVFLCAGALLHAEPIPNELIDYAGFQSIVVGMSQEREQKRLTEADFLAAMKSDEYVLLDARSAANFERRHVSGAVNVPFTEFTAQTLAAAIPSKDTKILIYCNNNFRGSPVSLATKAVTASLNLNTQASLRSYGYTEIYELGPAVDVRDSLLPFSGTEVTAQE